MKLNKINFIEKFVLVTFPVALAVGCTTTTDQHPNTASASETSLSQRYDIKPAVNPEQSSLTNMENSGSLKNPALNTKVSNHDTPAQVGPEAETVTAVYEDDKVAVRIRQPGEDDTVDKPVKNSFQFAINKYDISGADLEAIKQHAHYLRSHPDLTLYVDGFSDSRGSSFNNYKLSKKRAQQVADLLKSYGAPQKQIKVNGYGESFPVSNEKNWAENRRVELEYANDSQPAEMVARNK
jgi:outer membrane protein OmpA-like peptidoglycan-associated protein